MKLFVERYKIGLIENPLKLLSNENVAVIKMFKNAVNYELFYSKSGTKTCKFIIRIPRHFKVF